MIMNRLALFLLSLSRAPGGLNPGGMQLFERYTGKLPSSQEMRTNEGRLWYTVESGVRVINIQDTGEIQGMG